MRWIVFTACLMMTMVFRASAQLAPDVVSETMLNASVKEVLGEAIDIQWQKKAISEPLRKHFKTLLPEGQTHYYVGQLQSEPPLTLLLATAKGKVELFVFAVYFREETGEIWEVDVLDYREAYGGEIDYRAFRKQFKGKARPKEIIFRRTIRNISGATISARSITKKVREVLAFYQYLRQQDDEGEK